MPNRPYSHIAAVAADLAAHLRSLGFADRDIFRGTGLNAFEIQQEGARASLPMIIALFNRAKELTGNELFGLEWGLERRAKRMGLIGYVGSTSPTLFHLLQNLARFRRVFSEPMTFDTTRLQSDGVFAWSYRIPPEVDTAQFAENQTALIYAGASRAVARRLQLRQVRFQHLRTRNISAFTRAFGCSVQFGQTRCEIALKPSDLDLPLVTSDEALHKILVQHAEMVLAQTPAASDDVRMRVERAIADRLASGEATQDQIARDIGMSARTLARRLDAEGTSYQKVLANLRKALAERYLREGDVSQREIAYLLGYSDVSSFASAFKRWTGHSPGEVRHGPA